MSENTASAQARELEKVATKKRGAKKDVSSDPSLNMDELRELAALFDEHALTDFEFENENIRVRMTRQAISPRLAIRIFFIRPNRLRFYQLQRLM